MYIFINNMKVMLIFILWPSHKFGMKLCQGAKNVLGASFDPAYHRSKTYNKTEETFMSFINMYIINFANISHKNMKYFVVSVSVWHFNVNQFRLEF